jgi:hypothetical protein
MASTTDLDDTVEVRELFTRLGLMPEEVAALARQGSVSQEVRQRSGNPTGLYYKLRWRQQGRQRVTCLGRDRSLANAVLAALLWLQAPRRRARRC